MRYACWILGLLVWLAVPATQAGAAEQGGPAPAGDKAESPAPAKGADIAPAAQAPVRAMCDALKSRPAFSFTAEVSEEEVYPNGQSVQLTRMADVAVKRPDKLYARITGDERDRVFVYDGKTVSVADLNRGVYATLDAPPTIDATLDMLESKYGLVAPLSDLLHDDPCVGMLQNVRTGDCVGSHTAAGKTCDHLVFAQKDTDWQLWVEKNKDALPRKLVITDKGVMGWPQYAATFTKWDLNPHLAPGLFTFTPEKDAHRIDFLPLVSRQGETK